MRYYLGLDYPIQIERMEGGKYCASIPLLKGCKGYGDTPTEAMKELQGVKEALVELMIEQRKKIPEPSVELSIPVSEFERMPNKKRLKQFVKSL